MTGTEVVVLIVAVVLAPIFLVLGGLWLLNQIRAASRRRRDPTPYSINKQNKPTWLGSRPTDKKG